MENVFADQESLMMFLQEAANKSDRSLATTGIAVEECQQNQPMPLRDFSVPPCLRSELIQDSMCVCLITSKSRFASGG